MTDNELIVRILKNNRDDFAHSAKYYEDEGFEKVAWHDQGVVRGLRLAISLLGGGSVEEQIREMRE